MAIYSRQLLAQVAQGLLVRRRKPVFWSPSSRTALAEAELEYQDHASTAAHVLFDVTAPATWQPRVSGRLQALIWTTTPWTLPANRAVSYNPKLT